MKKKYKIALWIIPLLFLLYFFSPISFWGNEIEWWEISSQDLIVKVEKKSFDSNIEVNWTTKIKNEQKIRFNQEWKVIDVNFSVWDKVKKWDIVAQIDTTQALNDIEKAKLQLNNSKVKLNNYLEVLNNSWLKNSNLDIDSKKSEIASKKADLEYLEKKQKNDLEAKELELKSETNSYKILEKETEKNILSFDLSPEERIQILEEKKVNLFKSQVEIDKFEKEFKQNLDKKINEYYSKLESEYFSLKSAILNAEKNLREADKVLSIDNYNNFTHYEYFSAKKIEYRNNSRANYTVLKENIKKLQENFDKISDKKDSVNIYKTLEIQKTVEESVYNLANSMTNWFDNSVSTIWFSDSEISSYQSIFSSISSSSKSIISDLTSRIDELKTIDWVEKITSDLNSELKLKKNSLENLKIEIKKLEDNQNFLVDTHKYSIEIERIKLEKAKKMLENLILELEQFKKKQVEDLKQEKIALEKLKLDLIDLEKNKSELEDLSTNSQYTVLKNDVKQNEVILKDAHKKLENYILQAPFDGIITSIDIKPWDRLNSDTQKYISIVDPDTIEVKTWVNQSDIIKLKKWAVASLELSAYPKDLFTWTVSEVDTTPTDVNWISKFETKVLLKNPDNLKLYSGMKAIVKIKYDTIPESLVVPFTSINTDAEGNKFVTVVSLGGNEKRIVEVWFTDWKKYQILSWLEEWEEVLEIDYNSDLFKWEWFWFSQEEEFE